MGRTTKQTTSPLTLRQVIGDALRRYRLGSSPIQTQDEVADTARLAGLDWTRATVAAIELGRRTIELEELLLLTASMKRNLADWFDGDGWVELKPESSATMEALRALVSGKRVTEYEGAWDFPGRRLQPELLETFKRYWDVYHLLWPEAHSMEQLLAAAAASKMDAETKAARQFDVHPMAVAMAAYSRWGHGLTVERDRIVDLTAPKGASARSVQARRGQVTQRLIAEMADDLRRAAKEMGK